MTALQFGLFSHRGPDVDIEGDDYRDGFAAGHVSPRKASEPAGKSAAYLAGWHDARARSAVPDWRMELWSANRDRLLRQLIEAGHGVVGLQKKTNTQLRRMTDRLKETP